MTFLYLLTCGTVLRLGNFPENEAYRDTGALVIGFYYILP
jgi:hypothetical protein